VTSIIAAETAIIMDGDVSSLTNSLLGILGIIVLVLLNGFFVAAEFALVSVRHTRVEELIGQGNRAARVVKKAIHDPDRFIAATQLGITLASLSLGWVGEPALSHLIDPIIALIPIPPDWHNITSHSISAAFAFAIITFLHVVVGELAPKSIALQRPEQTSLVVAQPTIWTEQLFRPAIWLLNGTGNLLLRLLGFEPAAGHELAHSLEEIKMLLQASAARGLLEDSEHDMLEAVFNLRLMLVRQVMIPRTEMAAIPVEASLHDLMSLQKEHSYTKFPVYTGDTDHIIGIIYVRDVVDELSMGNLDAPIRPFIREAIFLPETTRINAALTAFRESRHHIAIVLDEYGGTAGLVTLEDVLEEIAGEMPDQFEHDEMEITRLPDGTWRVSGLTLIVDVNEELGLSLSDDNYDTIGGYVMGQLGHIPEKGNEVTVDGVRFCVEQVVGKRADVLRVVVPRLDPKSTTVNSDNSLEE
jgi:CBS domain containing-hemolysin-like protein